MTRSHTMNKKNIIKLKAWVFPGFSICLFKIRWSTLKTTVTMKTIRTKTTPTTLLSISSSP
jgi:hypothetical protein